MTIAKTASEAKALGLTTYYTGRLCDEGHDAERWAITKRCVVCQPTDRSKEYVQEMWQAFSAAYCQTLKTGFLHVPDQRSDGWWIVPVRDPLGPHEEVEGIQEYRLDG